MNESNQFNLSEQELAQISRFCLNPLSSETRVLLLVSLTDLAVLAALGTSSTHLCSTKTLRTA